MKSHWDIFYKEGKCVSFSSDFCLEALEEIKPNSSIIELGCGNGRDSKSLADKANTLFAFDNSLEALKTVEGLNIDNIVTVKSDFTSPNWNIRDAVGVEAIDYVYSRFLLHCLPVKNQKEVLKQSISISQKGIMFECRSADDDDVRFYHDDHDRLLIDVRDLLDEIHGLDLDYTIEHSRGLAKYKNENPKVLRVKIYKNEQPI